MRTQSDENLRRHLPAEERREATVAAVIRLAGEQNPRDITTSAIAKAMGLTQGALFRHFPTKEDLLQAVMGWVSRRLLARVDAAIGREESPVSALEAVFLAHIRFVSKFPGAPRMIFGELQRPGKTGSKEAVETLMNAYSERLCRLLRAGQAQGQLRHDLDVQAAATLFIGSIQGLVMQSMLTDSASPMDSQAKRIFAIYLQGIVS